MPTLGQIVFQVLEKSIKWNNENLHSLGAYVHYQKTDNKQVQRYIILYIR